MNERKYYGPFTIHVDHDNQVTRVILKGWKPGRWQLSTPEIQKLRDYVMGRVAEYGYLVVEG